MKQITNPTQGRQSVFLSEGAGDERQAPNGRGGGGSERGPLIARSPFSIIKNTSCLTWDMPSII